MHAQLDTIDFSGLDTLGSQMLAHQLDPSSTTLGLPASEPVGTGASTLTTGTNTITNVPGGVSTSNLFVADTSAFKEIPGRIYITVPTPTPVLSTSSDSLLPLAGVGAVGLGAAALSRRSRRRRTA